MTEPERLTALTKSIQKTKDNIQFFLDKGDIELYKAWSKWLEYQLDAKEELELKLGISHE
jgi:hypothetical protein